MKEDVSLNELADSQGRALEMLAVRARELRVPAAVALAAAVLYGSQLGSFPLVDASEGFHVAIAHEMVARGDWITPHFDSVRYFDKPPLLYWLMAAGLRIFGPSLWSVRLWSLLAVVGTAGLTAWIGTRLGSERLGLLAGLMAVVNLEVFLFGRFAKPDLLFVFFITLAVAGFIEAYRSGSKGWLLVCYGGLAATVMAKDFLGAVGLIGVFALFFALVREPARPSRWMPWLGLGLIVLVTVPWHLAMEWRNPGFLQYMFVDNHLLNLAGHRAFPDEDVPLTALEFLGVTALGFFPWSLAVPWAVLRALRRPLESPEARIWLLLGLWGGGFIAVLALSPFKLPHYGLPAFPALALLVAKLWDDILARRRGAPSARVLLGLPLGALAGVTFAFAVAWSGNLLPPAGLLSVFDLQARNLAAQGREVLFPAYEQVRPWLLVAAIGFGAATVGTAVALRMRLPALGLGALFAAILAFLPVATEGLALVARVRSSFPLGEALRGVVGPEDVVAHEGALENSGGLVLALGQPVKIVNGTQSNLAFGKTFAEAADIFWNADQLEQAWRGGRRIVLVSVVPPRRSVVTRLPADRVHTLLSCRGRWIYSNLEGEDRWLALRCSSSAAAAEPRSRSGEAAAAGSGERSGR